MTNRELADVFSLIANLLEIKGETIYVILAYRKAATSLLDLGGDINQFWKDDKLLAIPGVGKSIAPKIDELLRTGRLSFLDKLQEEVPAGLAEWLQIPGLGPKKAALIWKTLGITTMAELVAAAKEGKLRALPGMGEKSEALILKGIEFLGRRTGRVPLGRAWPAAQQVAAALRSVPGVVRVEPAGSLRRMRPTVGDLDILVASADSPAVMHAFTTLPAVTRVLGKGDTKSSVEFADGTRAQVWVHPPEKFGTALQYATGSRDHNVRLRQLALEKGLSLSEHALTRTDGSGDILCATEEEVYGHLGLPWIPPELREDRGEVQAAQAGALPRLIEVGDIRADLQTHSTWSDGVLSLKELAMAAARRGIKVIAFTDHSQGLGMVGGLTPEKHAAQAEEIRQAQRELGDSILLLHASEVEIRADGSLDYPDEFLATLDLVVASLHTALRQDRATITERLLRAVRNPHVDIIGHPTGRLIPDRAGADLDMEAVLAEAAKSGVALEINASPFRLDLEDVYARRAKEMGIPLSINTDAHAEADLDMLPFGVAVARRAWLTARDVINTWSTKELLGWLKKRGGT